jgi:hypothetical protein
MGVIRILVGARETHELRKIAPKLQKKGWAVGNNVDSRPIRLAVVHPKGKTYVIAGADTGYCVVSLAD